MTYGPILDVECLSVSFTGRSAVARILSEVSFTLSRGESLAVVGESGSGKSTLGLAVSGLLGVNAHPRMTGSMRLDGTQLVGATEPVLRRIRRDKVGIVFQDPMTSLNPTMTIGRQLTEALASGEQALDWLERVRIRNPAQRLRSFPHELSGGERQRVMLAIAMASHPALLVADEPTTALDVTVQAQILDLLRDMRRERDTALLFVTHDLGVAASIADRILVLYAGRIVETGPIGAVLGKPAHPYTAALMAARFGLDVDRSRPLPAPFADHGRGPATEGCSFKPRCPLAVAPCEVAPPLQPLGGRRTRCWRGDDVDAALWNRPSPPDEAPTVPTNTAVLELLAVRKSYALPRSGWRRPPDRVALQGFDLKLMAGEAVALVGESGSGKSTVLRVASGLVKPDAGDVISYGARPQMIFQDAAASLTPWLTVGELVGERLLVPFPKARERRARVAALLSQVGLDPRFAQRRAAELSGGQCQRVAIARAIAVPPRVLLCDEPISAVDVSLAAGILNLITDLRRRHRMAIIFVTHDLAAARYIADRIIVLKDGAIVEEAGSDRIVSNPRHPYTRQLLDALPFLPRVAS